MADSPKQKEQDLVSFSIMIEGSELPGTMMINSIEVKKEINKIPTAVFSILDGDWAKSDFEISSKDTFKPGAKVKITVGYHQKEESIFEGVIVGHGIRIPEDSMPTVTVKCVDMAAKMTVDRKNAYFADVKDSDVMSKLISAHGLSATVESTSLQHERVLQFQSSDWDMLLTRADANGFVVVVDDGKVGAKKPETSKDSLKLTMGTDIKRLDLDVDARFQLPAVSTEGWDYSANTVTHSESAEPSVPATGNLKGKALSEVLGASDFRFHSAGPISSAELTNWANAKLMRSRYSMVRGTISFLGNPMVKPDTTINLSGLGTRFTGTAYVSAVYHKIKAGLWDTEATIGLPSQMYAETQRDIVLPPASGLLPPVHGIQIGVVKQIDSDPLNETRILIDIPMIAASGDGVWARQALYYGTNGAGNFFMPEIGDEVLVAFVNADPRFPIIVGSVYSQKHPPAYTPDAPNTYKAITTNSKMKIEFEDVKKIITIWTPAGNYIEINDDKKSITILDETANKMVMDPKGITWHTPKDFKLTSDGVVDIKAKGKISMKSDADVTIDGINITSTASAANTMKGAKCEVNGSGMTIIKGGTVMIN